MPLGLQKTEKEGFNNNQAAKPAYISVSLPKSNERVFSNDATDSGFKPSTFPKSLRGYVERALASCKEDRQKEACQAIMKEIITKATADGTLYTKDWDSEPLFSIPNAAIADKDGLKSSSPASLPKYKSPSRRSKSRWEPLPDEKSAEKSVPVNNSPAKFGGWINAIGKDRKPSIANSEGKIGNHSNSRYFHMEQKSASKTFQRPNKRQCLNDGKTADNGDASSDSDKEQSLTQYYSSAIAIADSPEEKKRRENRSKRFDRGQGKRAEMSHWKLVC